MLTEFSVGNAVSANLIDTNKLPFNHEVLETVKRQKWISDEYQHLWRRDEGGSAALTSHGILSELSFLPILGLRLNLGSIHVADSKRWEVVLFPIAGQL